MSRPQSPTPATAIRAFQLDLARHPEEPAEIIRMARIAAGWGCTHLVLYLEGVIASPACPHPAAPRVYSEAEVRRFAAGIQAAGLQIVPVLPCLAHAEHFVRSPEWRHLAEDGDGHGRFGAVTEAGTLCPSHPSTVPLLAAHLAHVCSLLPGADLHLGLDEAFNLGSCPRCSRLADLGPLWTAHLRSLVAALAPLGRRLWIWDDAIELYPEALDAIPTGVLLCHWQYEGQIDGSGIQARLVNRWRRDWLALYRARGREVLACPWIKVPLNALQLSAYALRHPGTGLLLTSWDHTHRIQPTLGLVGRATFGIWAGAEPEQVWAASATAIAGDQAGVLAALGSLTAPLPVYPQAILLGGSPSVEEDLQERMLGALEAQLGRLPAGDAAEGCDGRMLAWWTRWRRAQLALRRHLPGLADPSLPAGRRRLAAEAATTVAGWLDGLAAELPEALATLGGGDCDRRLRERHAADLGRQIALAHRLIAAPPPALLVLRLRHQDCWGRPELDVAGDGPDGAWTPAASGCWKPVADGAQPASGHFTAAFPLERLPARLRLRGGGLGGAGLCFAEVRHAGGARLPCALLGSGGAVDDPAALLRDDSRDCRFGDWDVGAAMRRPPGTLPEGWVELALA